MGRRKWWARRGALECRVIRLQLAAHCRKGVGERCDMRLPRRASDAPGAPEKEGERQPAGAAFAVETERRSRLSQRLWQEGPPQEALQL